MNTSIHCSDNEVRIIDGNLRGLEEFAVTFLSVTITFGEQEVLEHLTKAALTAKTSKCRFEREEVEYL